MEVEVEVVGEVDWASLALLYWKWEMVLLKKPICI